MSKPPMPTPGKSEQSVQTPPELLKAVHKRLWLPFNFDWDLAADCNNSVCDSPYFYTEADNALIQPWKVGQGWNWCNPPYANIAPWVQKAYTETVQHGAKTAMLVPASVGSKWWAYFVENKCHPLYLQGRVTFVGHTKPYPKDLVLLLYSPVAYTGHEIWYWRD